MTKPVVVKFGGSLLGAPERDGLLAAASRHGAIMAPGGGAFADAVRSQQRELGFSDEAAHRAAILAMDQTALILADLAPYTLALCETAAAMSATLAAGLGAVWRPSPMALAAPLPGSWDVTSDSLALWLAIEIGAARLLLLKSAAPPADGVEAWARSGLVDRHFPTLAARFGGEIGCLGPATAAGLDETLRAPLRAVA